ncbi:MAG: 5-methyltetrahydropteroyltriglutamate--homocysteine S-methyltransferase [Candidatus Goldbacteria bacterium]|nr:5-methyltetrahydropteroyltriglutamate--homocysteine S-methyltransferase [Candidatus Goldiibacteriota bacterium]
MNKGLRTFVTGFPRIGKNRELKKVLESFWDGKLGFDSVTETADNLKKTNWETQKRAGMGIFSCGDFSYYDQMLDMAVMLGAVPERFQGISDPAERYFAMARGSAESSAMEMTKWFNTNYHYIVPELKKGCRYKPDFGSLFKEYRQAEKLGYRTKLNVIGPVTFLMLSKRVDSEGSMLELLPEIIPAYREFVNAAGFLGKEIYVQFDEPWFVKDCGKEELKILKKVYGELCGVSKNLKIIVMTYFDSAVNAAEALKDVNIWGVGLDFVYGPENVKAAKFLKGKKLIAGVVDGRNIWKNNYEKTLNILGEISKTVYKEDIIIAPSCSLLHVPYSLKNEKIIDSEIKGWFSFAGEKLAEIKDIADIFTEGKEKHAEKIEQNRAVFARRESSAKVNDPDVKKIIKCGYSKKRSESFKDRKKKQEKVFCLPLLPVTTIGSFPQTEVLRRLRRGYKTGAVKKEDYDKGIYEYIDNCIAFQEKTGFDVLVHGEPERNDMVEYFGERMKGFIFTENGWVQSYGTRCVKPPVIYGDVKRAGDMTGKIILYAQKKTKKNMKGMLTGPVTILNWSFVRDDIQKKDVCVQIALAVRDEIRDLQFEGIKIIQVDEAAFREGYPLKKSKAFIYEIWAVECFRVAVSGARPETQIHTHMCYSDFRDIMPAIKAMDADVITIETSKSGNKLLETFKKQGYENEIGPGVYDVHSPRVPSVEEFENKIKLLLNVFPAERLWINPDCGLKTRKWEETEKSLQNMVEAVANVRKSL